MNNLPQTYESVVQQRDELQKKLLAYEQAAKNPVAFVDERSAASGGICWAKSGKRELPHGTELYVVPVLPKHPKHSRQHFESLCNQFWNWAEFDEINQDEEPRLEWDGSNYTNRVTAALWKMYQAAPAQPVIPGQLTLRMAEEKALSLGAVLYDEEAEVFADGWNACCAEMLKAQSVSEPCKLNGWISVDNELPEEGARVLVFSDGAFVLLAEFTGGEFYDVVRDGEEFFETVTRCVTHWMPLPAAPAQESE